jgi:hypothetical protein
VAGGAVVAVVVGIGASVDVVDVVDVSDAEASEHAASSASVTNAMKCLEWFNTCPVLNRS